MTAQSRHPPLCLDAAVAACIADFRCESRTSRLPNVKLADTPDLEVFECCWRRKTLQLQHRIRGTAAGFPFPAVQPRRFRRISNRPFAALKFDKQGADNPAAPRDGADVRFRSRGVRIKFGLIASLNEFRQPDTAL